MTAKKSAPAAVTKPAKAAAPASAAKSPAAKAAAEPKPKKTAAAPAVEAKAAANKITYAPVKGFFEKEGYHGACEANTRHQRGADPSFFFRQQFTYQGNTGA